MIRRSWLLAIAAVALLLTACGDLGSEASRGPLPECNTPNRGRLLLMAQSVPSAQAIPCISSLPPGWAMVDAKTATGGSALRFDNDTHDLDAVVRLSATCDLSTMVEIPSDRPGALLFTGGEELAYQFATGCITFEFPTAAFAVSADGRALVDSIDFLTRDELRVLSNRTL